MLVGGLFSQSLVPPSAWLFSSADVSGSLFCFTHRFEGCYNPSFSCVCMLPRQSWGSGEHPGNLVSHLKLDTYQSPPHQRLASELKRVMRAHRVRIFIFGDHHVWKTRYFTQGARTCALKVRHKIITILLLYYFVVHFANMIYIRLNIRTLWRG